MLAGGWWQVLPPSGAGYGTSGVLQEVWRLQMELGHPSRLLEEIKIVSVEFCAGVKAEAQTRRRSGPVT